MQGDHRRERGQAMRRKRVGFKPGIVVGPVDDEGIGQQALQTGHRPARPGIALSQVGILPATVHFVAEIDRQNIGVRSQTLADFFKIELLRISHR